MGAMKRVRLLSEVHPLTDPALDALDALQQAREWFGYDIESAGGENYAEKNALIADAATAEDSLLVVRDWSHLDFIGFPNCAIRSVDFPPSRRLRRHLRYCVRRRYVTHCRSLRAIAP